MPEEATVVQGGATSLHKSDDSGLSQNTVAQRSRNVRYYLAASVSLLTFLVYLKSLQNEFVNWDDDLYVYENPNITSFSLKFFKWAFFGFHAGNWHPLTWISHAADYAVWGLNPLGHHLTNNVLHAINTFLVVVLVARLLEAGNHPSPALKMEGTSFTISFSPFTLIAATATGLLFGLHPVHVESVAWVAERKDLLCALFFLFSIITYTKYVTEAAQEPARRINKQYLFSVVFFILALLSKPMAVTLPLVLLLLDWYPLQRFQSREQLRTVLVEKIPFIALSIISSVLTVFAQKAAGAIATTEAYPLSTRILVAAKALVAYLWNMIVPLNLTPFYPYPKSISPAYLFPVALVAGITGACLLTAKKHKEWLSAWGYYVIMLIPVLGIVQVGSQAMADRYTYLPSLGPFLLVGLVAAWLLTKIQRAKKPELTSKIVTLAAVILLLVPLVYMTLSQIRIWKNSITLWTYVIKNRPDEIPIAYNNRGLFFMEKGQLDKAKEDLDKAIALAPYYYEAYYHRGMIFMNLGQYGQALKDLDKAIDLNPLFYSAYNNRGMVLGNMGQLDKAIEDFTTAISLNQTDVNAFLNRGLLLLQVGRIENAASDLRNACDLGNDFGCKTLQSLENNGK